MRWRLGVLARSLFDLYDCLWVGRLLKDEWGLRWVNISASASSEVIKRACEAEGNAQWEMFPPILLFVSHVFAVHPAVKIYYLMVVVVRKVILGDTTARCDAGAVFPRPGASR